MIMRRNILYASLALGFLSLSCSHHQKGLPTVEETLYGFENIQDSARSKVWWFHGETETTKEGITADLEAFKKAGLGGVVYYDQTHGVKESKIKAMSPEWWELLKFASQECKRLGLTFETHISNGYVAGGPWITPDLGMQQLTSVDTIISGGRHLSVKLPDVVKRFDYSGDVAVLAFPHKRDNFTDSRVIKIEVKSSVQGVNPEEVFNSFGRLATFAVMPEGKAVNMTADFGTEFTARSISYTMTPRGKAQTSSMQVPSEEKTFNGTGYFDLPDIGELQVSDDGVNFNNVCILKPQYRALGGSGRITLSFPETKGRYFRVNLHDWSTPKDKTPELEFGRVVISSAAMVDTWEEKAGLYPAYISSDNTPDYPAEDVVSSNEIVNLTSMMDSNGNLEWDAPAGDWKIIRFAHIPTGGHTKHGRPEMNALECDKMSKKAIHFHWDSYMAQIVDSIRKSGGRIDGVAMDSHEAGPQNWTSGFEKEFERLRGYDLVKYLPVMAGYVVDSSDISDRVLYDVRRTIADLTNECYFFEINKICEENGLDYTQQDFGALCYAGDPLAAKGKAKKPQGEFWVHHPNGTYDIKEVSSSAHIYGKPIASAESFTDINYKMSPADMKWLADCACTYGINEFVTCASSHQPWTDGRFPGCTGGGRHYALDRCNPYWDYYAEELKRQARTAFVMRQGQPVIDFCVYLGDNVPVRILSHRLPDIPKGYDFDATSTDGLLTRLMVKDGMIATENGMRYYMLILPEHETLSLAALRKIHSLVKEGGVVYGPKPTASPSQAEQAEDKEYERLAADLWQGEGVTKFGKGRVYSTPMALAEVIASEKIVPDVDMQGATSLLYNHRKLADGDVYFITNHDKEKRFDGHVTLRTSGNDVEAWRPVDATRNKLSHRATGDGRIAVDLNLEPGESYIVVVSGNDIPGNSQPIPEFTSNVAVESPWRVGFDAKLGGPGEVVFPELTDWTESEDPRIKYYSGTAIYKSDVKLNKTASSMLKVEPFNGALMVRVNGKEAGTIWSAPWQVDISDMVKEGSNSIELTVANSAINRMIGDLVLPDEKKITFSTTPIVNPTDNLRPSGLKGKVRILQSRQ